MRNLLRRYGLAAALAAGVIAILPRALSAADEKQVEHHLQAFYEMALWNDGKYPSAIRKWTQPIRMRIAGRMADTYAAMTLERLQELTKIAGVEVIHLKPDDKTENFFVEFVDTELYAAGRSAGCVAYTWWNNTGLTKAHLLVNLRQGFRLRRCITHEGMHAMGLPGHPHAFDSVLSYTYFQSREDLSDTDKMVLRVLYDPLIKHGTNQLPAMTMAQLVLVDKLIANGAPEDTRTLGQRFIKNLLPLTVDLAEKGNLGLQYQLGLAYTFGQAVEKDEKAGFEWFRRVALSPPNKDWDTTITDAQFMVAWGLSQGRGVEANPGEAVSWYKRLASRDHTVAQNNLGVAYRDGKGVERDPVEAYKWLSIAAAKKHRLAETNIEKLVPLMTPVQVEEAKRRAAGWKPGQ